MAGAVDRSGAPSCKGASSDYHRPSTSCMSHSLSEVIVSDWESDIQQGLLPWMQHCHGSMSQTACPFQSAIYQSFSCYPRIFQSIVDVKDRFNTDSSHTDSCAERKGCRRLTARQAQVVLYSVRNPRGLTNEVESQFFVFKGQSDTPRKHVPLPPSERASRHPGRGSREATCS